MHPEPWLLSSLPKVLTQGDFEDAAMAICPWNAYPWYINRDPTDSELGESLPKLLWLLSELKRCRVVIFFGAAAHRQRLTLDDDPQWRNLCSQRGLTVLGTFHPSPRAVTSDKQGRTRHIFRTLYTAALVIGRSPLPDCTCPASRTTPGSTPTTVAGALAR